ncbi:transmembrane protein 45B-like [Hemicordylus capensis]|uniref:transmembrane protein 45B-like n=1 Tax=Hemicordylus capensis TaxID=884348 RepID=UPI002303466A|nr:transmembrane protein 45B-like [Hemicordylus capensis]XP_053125889.1 transmembrane protein 45B-like [Hemicordylus capensis]
MPSFTGSALQGTFFLLLGLWWSIKYPVKYILRKLNADNQSSRWIQCMDIVEGTAKTFFALGGILAEQFDPDGPHMSLYDEDTKNWVQLMNWQHMTMYLFYGFSGVVDVLTYSPIKLPVGLDRLLVAIALLTEGFLFHFHDYEGAALSEHIYSLLLIAVFGGALCALLEVFQRDHILLELFRASLFILQGSWFWQIGFVLYPPGGAPGWNQASDGNKNFLTICFFWHYAVGLLVMVVNGAASHWCANNCSINIDDIDLELDIGFCFRRKNTTLDPVLLPENSGEEK